MWTSVYEQKYFYNEIRDKYKYGYLSEIKSFSKYLLKLKKDNKLK